MTSKRDQVLEEIKAELQSWVKDFRTAQMDLERLREIGADETNIRHVMRLMGFGDITADEFLAAKSAEQIGQLIVKVNRAEPFQTGAVQVGVSESGKRHSRTSGTV